MSLQNRVISGFSSEVSPLAGDLLARHGIRSWVKMSGGAGLHVMVPLRASHSFEEVRAAAELITYRARAREPKLFSFETRASRRRGRILIDTGRNEFGATYAAAYAVRPKPTAPVSAPCTWDEVESGAVYPQTFTLRGMAARLDAVGDLWADLHGSPSDVVLSAAKDLHF